MGKRLTSAAVVLGLAAGGVWQGCAEDTAERTVEEAKEKLRTQQAGPLDIRQKEDRERILKALKLTEELAAAAKKVGAEEPTRAVEQPEFTVITDLAKFPENFTEEEGLRMDAEAALGLGGGTEPTLPYYLPLVVTEGGEPILGFTTGGRTVLTEAFFAPHQTAALRATALHTLAVCQATGDCTVYNGPYAPNLPTAIATDAQALLTEVKSMSTKSNNSATECE